MNVRLGTALALSAVVAVAASTATVAATNVMETSGSAAPVAVIQQDERPLPDGAPPEQNAPTAIGVGAGSEMQYVPITPCRIVDTRKPGAGGKIAAGAQRSLVVKGSSGFDAQGGKTGGCGIPSSATAVTASFTTTESTGKGRLNAYPVGTSEPTSTVLSYTNTNKVTAGATLAIAKSGSPHLRVHNYDYATHFGIDITGYYVPQLAAYVANDGTLLDGSSRVVGVQKLGTGYYTVQFDRNVENCVSVATSDIDPITVAARTIGDKAYLYTYNTAGVAVNYWFNLVVTC